MANVFEFIGNHVANGDIFDNPSSTSDMWKWELKDKTLELLKYGANMDLGPGLDVSGAFTNFSRYRDTYKDYYTNDLDDIYYYLLVTNNNSHRLVSTNNYPPGDVGSARLGNYNIHNNYEWKPRMIICTDSGPVACTNDQLGHLYVAYQDGGYNIYGLFLVRLWYYGPESGYNYNLTNPFETNIIQYRLILHEFYFSSSSQSQSEIDKMCIDDINCEGEPGIWDYGNKKITRLSWCIVPIYIYDRNNVTNGVLNITGCGGTDSTTTYRGSIYNTNVPFQFGFNGLSANNYYYCLGDSNDYAYYNMTRWGTSTTVKLRFNPVIYINTSTRHLEGF